MGAGGREREKLWDSGNEIEGNRLTYGAEKRCDGGWCWWERGAGDTTELEVEGIDADTESWSERQTDRQTDRGRDGGFLEGDGEQGWRMIVSFVQASSVANGEIAQISSFHVLCFWCGANLSAWPKLKRPIFTLSLSLSLSLSSFLLSSLLCPWVRGSSKAT